MRAWLYRRSDLEIVGIVDLPGDIPDLLFLGESIYIRRGDDVSARRVVYVEASVARVAFADLQPAPMAPAVPAIELIDDPTQPLGPQARSVVWDD